MSSLRALVRSRCGDDRGQLSILVLGLTVIAMTLVIGGLAVTSVHISRMRLLDAADSAALAATDDGAEQIYERGVGEDLPLDDALVQQSAAERAGIDPTLLVAANTSGGVVGKMISPQNLTIAATAVGLVGQESTILRKVLPWSVGLIIVMCLLVGLQSTAGFAEGRPLHTSW